MADHQSFNYESSRLIEDEEELDVDKNQRKPVTDEGSSVFGASINFVNCTERAKKTIDGALTTRYSQLRIPVCLSRYRWSWMYRFWQCARCLGGHPWHSDHVVLRLDVQALL